MSKQTLSRRFDKEQIYIVEIDVPRCKLVHGSAPCTATQTGNAKCYNTRSTCNDLANYDDQISGSTNYYTYRFCSERSPHPINLNNVAPCLTGVSVAPAKISASGGIGARASVSINFKDFPSSDRFGIDPYLSGRTYNPFDVGLFWVKWRARNANYENNPVRVLSGYLVNGTYSAANFEVRHYVLSTATATNGMASIKAKDPLQLVSNRSALAPAPSTGKLLSAITNVQTTLTLEPSGVGATYPTSGYVSIRDEVMAFTRSGDVMTITRGRFNTIGTAHSVGDTVQLCLHYDGTQDVANVQYDLVVNYAGVPASMITLAAWEAEAQTYLPSNPNRLITAPEKVDTLIDQLCQQWSHKLYWNERTAKVEMVAIKEPPATSNALTANSNIMELSVTDKPDMQVSTVFVFYGQFNPTKKVDEKDNYQVTFARVNVDAIARYNSNNTMIVYAPWIIQGNGAAARRLAQLHGRRFGIIPRECSFALEDKDSDVWLGDVRRILHPDIVDRNGYPILTAFEILEASEGEAYEYQALEYTYDGEVDDDDAVIGQNIVDLSISERNINLLSKYTAIYGTPNATTVARFIVYSGVTIGSTSNTLFSILTGSWPAGALVILQINAGGEVLGKGGNAAPNQFTAAQNGGTALSLQNNLELINNGVLGGGGGGGGVSVVTSTADGDVTAGGGAGAGDTVGVTFGNSYDPNLNILSVVEAENGSNRLGGVAGDVIYNSGGVSGQSKGGKGGDLGQAGQNAVTGGSNGGLAGNAVNRNGFTLTTTLFGDIRGSIV